MTETLPPRKYAFSDEVLAFSRQFLEQRGLSYEKPEHRKVIAAAIQKLSDYFIAQPEGVTPWDEDWAQLAYVAYYLPLNEIRNRAVVEVGLSQGFFDGLNSVVDFGAGPGTADFALQTKTALRDFLLVERSEVPARFMQSQQWTFERTLSSKLRTPSQSTLFVASYSLTEAKLPETAWSAEALMILEPSTQEDGRALMELRQKLIEKDFFIWAPCLHQEECPLLTHSKRDWCHDRVHVERFEDWIRLEELLPFRNQTITFSYLLARKTPPPTRSKTLARLVGDQMDEKGKSRQMICRGPQREFAAWLHRQGTPPNWPRGICVEIPSDAKLAGNEVRFSSK